jgi:hypothetical protein
MALKVKKPPDRFTEQLSEMSKRHPRLVEIMKGLEWELARSPEMFPVLTTLSSDDHRIARATLHEPPMYVIFAVTDKYVRLLLIVES